MSGPWRHPGDQPMPGCGAGPPTTHGEGAHAYVSDASATARASAGSSGPGVGGGPASCCLSAREEHAPRPQKHDPRHNKPKNIPVDEFPPQVDVPSSGPRALVHRREEIKGRRLEFACHQRYDGPELIIGEPP